MAEVVQLQPQPQPQPLLLFSQPQPQLFPQPKRIMRMRIIQRELLLLQELQNMVFSIPPLHSAYLYFSLPRAMQQLGR